MAAKNAFSSAVVWVAKQLQQHPKHPLAHSRPIMIQIGAKTSHHDHDSDAASSPGSVPFPPSNLNTSRTSVAPWNSTTFLAVSSPEKRSDMASRYSGDRAMASMSRSASSSSSSASASSRCGSEDVDSSSSSSALRGSGELCTRMYLALIASLSSSVRSSYLRKGGGAPSSSFAFAFPAAAAEAIPPSSSSSPPGSSPPTPVFLALAAAEASSSAISASSSGRTYFSRYGTVTILPTSRWADQTPRAASANRNPSNKKTGIRTAA
mmetsp:Transcript_55303/g.165779  ORF Transcript_55303/g.165779 Transcript_55303/m.165779 type:complete len:265 (+) Transcript_55303:903-1697(+)